MEANIVMNAQEFLEMLRSQGLVIGPAAMFEKDQVKGIPFREYRERILRKKLLSFREISRARLWGDITQKAVYMIAKEHVSESDQVRVGNLIKIPISVVKSIAISRGYEI